MIRELLTESVLLAAIGGALGVALAWWGIDVLTALLAGGRDHFTMHAALNWRVLGVTPALSVVTGLAFGLVPALQATRLEILPALKNVRSAQPAFASRRLAVGPFLIVIEIALSVVLLVGAGLFGRTLAKLHAIEIGFNRENVLLFTVRPSTVGYRGPELYQVFEDCGTAEGGSRGAGREVCRVVRCRWAEAPPRKWRLTARRQRQRPRPARAVCRARLGRPGVLQDDADSTRRGGIRAVG